MESLTPSESAFLLGLWAGERLRECARRLGYSDHWAKWISRRVRKRLGVNTLEEALAVSDLAGFERRLSDLDSKLSQLADAVLSAVTPQAKESARDDLASELKLRGLTLKDLDALREQRESERVNAAVEAALKRREEEAAAKAAVEEPVEEEPENGKTVVEKVRDGLGGSRKLDR